MEPEWSNINLKLHKSQSKWKSDYQPIKKIVKNKNYKNSEGRFVNTKEYAIAWGVINKPYSSEQLRKKCKDKEAPSYIFITQKCWNGYPRYYDDLVKAGMQPRPPRNDMQKKKLLGQISGNGLIGLLDKDYNIARMAASYGVTTKQSYIDIRKQKPQTRVYLPSMQCILRRFGTWKRFSYEIMKYNVDMVINEYVNKSVQCGHWLRLKQCDKIKLPIRGIMDMLRPTIFNTLCYKKLVLMNKSFDGKKQE